MRMIRERDRPAWDLLSEGALARFPIMSFASLKLLFRRDPPFSDPVIAAEVERFRMHYRIYLASGVILVALFAFTAFVHPRLQRI